MSKERKKASFALLPWFRKISIKMAVIVLVLIYFLVNLTFSLVYYVERISASSPTYSQETAFDNQPATEKPRISFGDCFYFSFITASTIGYGDILPCSTVERGIVVFQSVTCTVLVAVIMSILTMKMLWPTQQTIIFSKKIVHDRSAKMFGVRIINTNSLPILNPTIRITVTEHGTGNIISRRMNLDTRLACPQYLGKHDSTLWFGVGDVIYYQGDQEKTEKAYDKILQEYKLAKEYEQKDISNSSSSELQANRYSWFRIIITINGNNGVQDITEIKKYYASDFVEGYGFTPIKYSGKERRGLSVQYESIEDFWNDFDKVREEKNDKTGSEDKQLTTV